MSKWKSSFFAVFTFSLSASVFAQELMTTEKTEVAKKIEVASIVKETPLSRFPITMMKRPFTLHAGMWELGTSFFSGSIPFAEKASRFDGSAIGLSASYGVTEDLQLDVGYHGFETKNAQFSTGMYTGVGYYAIGTGWMFSEAKGIIDFDFGADGAQKFSRAKFAFFTVLPIISGKLALQAFNNDVLVIENKADAMAVSTNGVVKIAWQPLDNLYLTLGTNLGTINWNKIADSKYIFKETPVNTAAFFSFSNAVDVYAIAGFDNIQKANESLFFVTGLSVRGDFGI